MKSSQLRARYWRIVFFFGASDRQLHLLGDLPPPHRPGRLECAHALRALPAHRGALPRARHPHGRPDDQGRAVPLGAPRRAAARDHQRARRAAGRGAGRGVRGHPREGRGRAGRTARRGVRLDRRDADGRGVARPGAPGAAVRRGGRDPRVRGRGRQGPAPLHRAGGRGRPRGPAPRGRLAAALQAGQQAGRRARAGRGVRGDHARRDRLRGRGQERRDLRRQLRRRSAHPRAAGWSGT